MTEIYIDTVLFNGYLYILTNKNELIKKNLQTGEETRCKKTIQKWYTAKEIEEYINKDTKKEGFTATAIWDSVLKGEI